MLLCYFVKPNFLKSGIGRVVYICDKYAGTDEIKASKIMLKLANIKIEQFTPKRNKIVIDFESFVSNNLKNKNTDK